jgi:hypothetical protein
MMATFARRSDKLGLTIRAGTPRRAVVRLRLVMETTTQHGVGDYQVGD